MSGFFEIIQQAMEQKASDVFIVSGQPISFKINKRIVPIEDDRVMPERAHILVAEAYAAAKRDMARLIEKGDDDFAISMTGIGRMRMCAYKQRGSLAAVVRMVSFQIPDYRQIGIPENVIGCAQAQKGLVLVTGPAGNGKSTTLACIIDQINKTRNGHVITLEDPIEFLYRNDKCIISQREIEQDTQNYVTAIRASLRQAPNIILLGEMRDYETISAAMTAAETGHLVLSTLHTVGAADTVDRIIDIFPPSQQQQVRVQLSMQLHAVVSQQLVPTVDGGVAPAFEVMFANNAICNLIRDAKVHQIDSVIATSSAQGMISMDNSLLDLYSRKLITKETALTYSQHPEIIAKRLD